MLTSAHNSTSDENNINNRVCTGHIHLHTTAPLMKIILITGSALGTYICTQQHLWYIFKKTNRAGAGELFFYDNPQNQAEVGPRDASDQITFHWNGEALNLKDKSGKETTWFRNRATEQKRASERDYEDKRKRQRHWKSKERLREWKNESLRQRT